MLGLKAAKDMLALQQLCPNLWDNGQCASSVASLQEGPPAARRWSCASAARRGWACHRQSYHRLVAAVT
jgi:hypothetical protein